MGTPNKAKWFLTSILSFTCAALLYDISLRKGVGDYPFYKNLGEFLYTAFYRFHEFPIFSYYWNAGTYTIQDPQGPTLSIWSPLILLLGPISGTRALAPIGGLIGFWSFFIWISKKTTHWAAVFGAVSWVLSCGFFWRLIANHHTELWAYATPFFLWCIDLSFEKTKSPYPRAILVGGLIGIYFLGPVFQATTYYVAPIALLWFAIQASQNRGSLKEIIPEYGLTILVTLLIALPRVCAFLSFDMRRHVTFDGAIGFRPSLYALFATARTHWQGGVYLLGTNPPHWHHIWESNRALMPTASILGVLGFLLAKKIFSQAKAHGLFAGLLFLIGIALASSPELWSLVSKCLAENIRGPSRFLGLSAFGLAISAAFCLEWVCNKIPKHAMKIAGFFIASIFVFAWNWEMRAIESGSLQSDRMPLISYPELNELAQLPAFAHDSDADPAILNGKIILNGANAPGSGITDVEREEFEASIFPNEAIKNPVPITEDLRKEQIELSHGEIVIKGLEPQKKVTLKLHQAKLGEIVTTLPHGQAVDFTHSTNELVIQNPGPEIVQEVRIKPKSPVPILAWMISLLTFLAVLFFSVFKKDFKRADA